tara:strand:- start:158 stop:328 length:171 start_codon:yes stop_codon:yes gene_type:complete
MHPNHKITKQKVACGEKGQLRLPGKEKKRKKDSYGFQEKRKKSCVWWKRIAVASRK